MVVLHEFRQVDARVLQRLAVPAFAEEATRIAVAARRQQQHAGKRGGFDLHRLILLLGQLPDCHNLPWMQIESQRRGAGRGRPTDENRSREGRALNSVWNRSDFSEFSRPGPGFGNLLLTWTCKCRVRGKVMSRGEC